MKHYGFGHRLLAAFCTIILLVMMMPVGVFAAVDDETSDVDNSGDELLIAPVALDGEGETYKLTIPQNVENGTLTVTVDDVQVSEAEVQVAAGAMVVVTAVPAPGFKVEELVAMNNSSNLLADGDSFAMPTSQVDLVVRFEARESVNVFFVLSDGLKEKPEAVAYTDEEYTTTIEAEYGYELPESIEVEIDGTALATGDYTWAAGELTIASEKLTGDVTVTATGEELPYVSVSAALTNLNGEGVGKIYPSLLSDAYTYTITPSSGYELPDSIEVEIDGTALAAGDYTWAAGKLTIASEKLTGDVKVTAAGVPIEYTVKIDINKVNVESIYKNDDKNTNILNDESTTKDGKTVTFKATIEDKVVVNLKADRFSSVPDNVTVIGGDAAYSRDKDHSWRRYYNIATLTFEKGSVESNINVLAAGDPESIAYIKFIGMHGIKLNGEEADCLIDRDYSIPFQAEGGYTLPATITVKSGDTLLEDVTDNSEATVGYTWTGGTLTILKASLQDAVNEGEEIRVEATATLNADNYTITPSEPLLGTENKYGETVFIAPKDPAKWIVIDNTQEYVGIVIGDDPEALKAYKEKEKLEDRGYFYYPDGDYLGDNKITFVVCDKKILSDEVSLALSVDTTKPEVAVSGYSIESYSDSNSKHYTNDTITVTFDVSDTNFEHDKLGSYEVQINGTETTEGIAWSEDGKHCTVTLNCKDDTQELANELADGEYTVTLSVTDSARHLESATSETLVLDNTKPEVAVSGYSIESYSDSNSKHYTNDTITVTFDVSDTNFEHDKLGSYEVKIGDTKLEKGIAWSEDGKYCTVTLNCKDDTQELVNELADGEYTVTLSVTDAAENNKTATSETLVLDNTKPDVAVSGYSIGRYSETYPSHYTNDTITVTFDVSDTNFEHDKLGSYEVKIGDTKLEKGIAWSEDGKYCTVTLNCKDDTQELVNELADGEYTVTLSVTDAAENNKTATSETLVLDTTAPTIVSVTYEKVKSSGFQMLKEIIWWIAGKLDPSRDADGIERDVTMTIVFEDELSPITVPCIKNLNDDNPLDMGLNKLYFELEDVTREDGKRYYRSTLRFVATAQFKEQLMITAEDAAGNESDALATTMDENGVVTASPNLLIDTYAPTIDFDTIDYGTVHNSDYSVGVHILDPEVDDVYSGLKEIRVSVHYQQSAITTSAATVPGYAGDTVNGEYVYTKTFASSAYVQGEDVTVTIPVALHSNLVYVEVTAVDNAGNSKTVTTKDSGWYIKMDNVLPVISVVYDNNSAQNNKYFKDTRTATITVEDNNFNAAGMTLNTQGSLGTWTATGQTNADGQNYVYTCAVSYVPDADYTLSITGTDMAGNTTSDAGVSYANQMAPQDFTVDRTVPTFTISMANADVDIASGGYSNQDVIVTLSVTEHNFDANAATAGLTVLYEGNDISQSIRSGLSWSNNGDVHTATFTIKDDGEYKINLSFLDLAGNSTAAAEDVVVRVDKTNAMVYVTGVADQSANAQKEIVPVVTVWDKYYNEDGVVITLINGEGKNVTDKYLDMENGRSEVRYDEQKDLYYQTFTFQNITEDHVYYLEVRHTDLAGNVNSEMTVLDSEGKEKQLDLEKGRMRFSVNRNGSTYSANEETLAILGCYVQMAKNVRILEINVDELDPESIHITLTHDNVTRDLTYGEDYTYQVPPEQNDASWNVYEYVLSDSLFAEDGVYTISIYSVDAAGNVAQNNTEEKDFEITFVVDKTPPIFVALDLDSGAIYNEEQHTATINCSDNIAFDTVHVYRLDSTAEKDESGNYIWFREKANGETEMLCEEIKLTAVEGVDGDYTFVLYEGDSAATSKQSVLVVCTDKAGNRNLEQEILDFTVSSSFWIRFYANKPLFYGSIGGICALLIVAAVVFLRKKKDDERA